MALTQSAYPAGPSWDEEVVPALRQRLEGESRILSKRISTTIPVSSIDEPDSRPSYTRISSDRTVTPQTSKRNGASSSKRARTYSTPKLSDIPNKSRTPERDAKPTRIPKAARAGPTGNGQYTTPQSPPLNNGLLPPQTLTREPSQDTIHIPIRQTSGLLNEPPPFMPGPESANSHDDMPPRPSNESEERPFEHWYRGEVSRNGGVGELKHGKRAEMLEIANYGHTLQQKQALAASARATPDLYPRQRKRSESAAGLDRRESLYLDEDHAKNVGMVMDEGPLTDVDADMSDTDYYNQRYRQHDTSTSSAPIGREGSVTPVQTRQQGKRAPPQSSLSPPQLARGASEPPSFPTSSSSLSQSSRQLQTPKRAATASPPPASASKKPRAAATPKPKPKAKPPQRANTAGADEKNRRSVAYYPEPGEGDEDMADAIPTWTQPVAPVTGRWDDVVLPVVARKKGLDEMYEKTDGSPKPRKEERPIAPAAGTFGWDHSKYRPPRDDEIQMDEFGRPQLVQVQEEGSADQEAAFGNPLGSLTEHERQPVGPRGAKQQHQFEPPLSPAPFSDYRGPPKEGAVVIDLDLEATNLGKQQRPPPEDDGGAGCCKCVVM